jgi:proline iminopeptidase
MNSKFIFSILFFITAWQCKAQADFKTHYRTFGKGEPILIINGGPGMNSNGFADVAKKISDLGYMTIIFDQRGTGKSTLEKLDTSTITMDLMALDIENLRKELKIKKWTILGHSFGGLLACHYFSKYPERVDRIIFSSSGGVNMNFVNNLKARIQNNLTQTQRDSLSYYQNKITAGDTSYNTRKKRAGFLANAYVYNKKYANLIADRLMELNMEVNGLVVNDLFKINFNYQNMFIKNNVPVLVIQGKNDVISIETAEEIKNSFGNSKLKLLDNCGHYGWLDSPTEYFEAIDSFLKK